jgi:hypothetical protein
VRPFGFVFLICCPCRRYLVSTSLGRAAEMQAQVRVVKQQPPAVLAGLLDSLFSPQVCYML